jgi:hypothetical protein
MRLLARATARIESTASIQCSQVASSPRDRATLRLRSEPLTVRRARTAPSPRSSRGEGGVRGKLGAQRQISTETPVARSSNNFLQLSKDHGQNTVPIAQHVRVPETHNVITVRGERPIARAVARILCVPASIYFDYELFFSTNKIHDVGPDRFLADELESTQPPVAQREPQFSLGICGLSAQVSLETNGSFLRSAHCLAPHPTPLSRSRIYPTSTT